METNLSSGTRGLPPQSHYPETDFFSTCGSGGSDLKWFFNSREVVNVKSYNQNTAIGKKKHISYVKARFS